jgi:hypothetical protein
VQEVGDVLLEFPIEVAEVGPFRFLGAGHDPSVG